MIGFFPEPLPDELLFSTCSRYVEMTGYNRAGGAGEDLFKSRRFILSADFPSRLSALINVLPPGHHLTIDRLINNHTLLPLFTPFLSAQRVSVIKERMCGLRRAGLHGSLGVNTFPGKLKSFRYCAACVEEDRTIYGETYWHRNHHIPGVDICAAHQIHLRNTSVSFRFTRAGTAFVTAEACHSRPDLKSTHERKHPVSKMEVALAEDATWLLRHPTFDGYETNHRDRYIQLLYEYGYSTYRGVLDRKKLANEFICYYSHRFLKDIKCEVVTSGREDWLNRLAHGRDRLIHPIHHLLLQQFLGQKPESFLTAADSASLRMKVDGVNTSRKRKVITPFFRAPFGPGPWPCLNPVGEHFHQEVVTSCEISSTQLHPRRPRGTFRCECGFAYSRVGPDQVPSDRYKIGSYVTFGKLWDDALLEGLARQDPYSVICQRLRVSAETLLRQMKRLGLKGTRGGQGPIPSHNPRQPQKRIHSAHTFRDRRRLSPKVWAQRRGRNRRNFLGFRKANPDFSRHQLLLKCNASYGWLYKHDRAWLIQHLPECHVTQKKRDSIWGEKDRALAAAVQVEAVKLRALPGRPVIISATSIAHKLEITHVWSKRGEIIPLTCEALSEVSETAEQFAVRRVEWATAQFQQEGVSATSWRIALLAGLSGKTVKKPAVRAALDSAVERLKSQMDLDFSRVNAA